MDFPKYTVVFNHLVTALVYETRNMHYYQSVLDFNFSTAANLQTTFIHSV